MRRLALVALTVALAVPLGACSTGAGTARPAASSSASGPTPSTTTAPTPAPPATPATTATPAPSPGPAPTSDPLAGWSLEQKVGQLMMVGIDVHAPGRLGYDAVRDLHVGNVFLSGRTQAGAVRVRNLVDWLTGLVSPTTTNGVPLLVATDQEGGEVQVLRGPGFTDLPSALDQAGLAPADLTGRAATWGAELARAGVNLDLAPVMDLVPSAGDAAGNPPIGALERNYGYTPDSVTAHANAFSAGMESAGVAVAIKHFPGLGRVTANPDVAAGVTDTVTTRDDPAVAVFAAGIGAGAAFVLTSTAVYTQLDPSGPAAFSPVVVSDLLRRDLGFGGVVITDDLSAATQVLAWSPGERAVRAIDAGNDLVLASRDPSVVPAMVDAVLGRARTDAAFAGKVDAAAARVLAAKARLAG